jgi:endonuclease/exonuclease/phosphatase family metal-dependent hydrolase
MATWVKLRSRNEPDVVFFLFNTHFDHVGQTARHQSAMLLRRRVHEICQGLPAIITGDFNAAADPGVAGPYRALIYGTDGDAPPWIDTYRHLHPDRRNDEGTFNGFTGAGAGPRIDWIVVTPHFEPLHAWIDRTSADGRFPSDHFPVAAVLGLREAKENRR